MALERLDPDDVPLWARHYADHVARYSLAAERAAGKRVLDVGTGPGYGAVILRAAGAASVTAIDFDAATVAAAHKRYARPGVTYAVGDAEMLDGLGPFDLVCSFENIEHLPHPERFVTAAARVLAPDGVLLCSTPDRRATPPFVNGRPANPYHINEWHIEEFRALLLAGFESVDLRAQVRGYGLAVREEAALGARAALGVHDTFVQRSFGARLRRLLGRTHWLDAARAGVEAAVALGTASPADYPVLPLETASLFGHPFCHFAVCTRPKG
jgi:SAM-dependent methyltransferase